MDKVNDNMIRNVQFIVTALVIIIIIIIIINEIYIAQVRKSQRN